MTTPVRLGAISFINTIPVYLLFEPDEHTELIYDSPARLNRRMATEELDISPVSSAFYLQNQKDLVLLDNLSVSSPGAVESVIFLSRKPLGPQFPDTEVVSVPDDSETSVLLLAHLIREETGENMLPRFKAYPAGQYRPELEETGNALVIGDEALLIHEQGVPEGFYCYDLSTLWRERTGMPFVFAVWVAGRLWAERNPVRLMQVSHYLQTSRDRFFKDPANLDRAVEAARKRCVIPEETIRRYFTQALNYDLDRAHLHSLMLFKQAIQSMVGGAYEQSAVS